MFVACLLDAFPEHREAVIAAAQALTGVPCRVLAHDDGVLTGSRFVVEEGSDHTATGHVIIIRMTGMATGIGTGAISAPR